MRKFSIQFPMNTVNKEFGKSHAQLLTSNEIISIHYYGEFEFITFLGELYMQKGCLMEAL